LGEQPLLLEPTCTGHNNAVVVMEESGPGQKHLIARPIGGRDRLLEEGRPPRSPPRVPCGEPGIDQDVDAQRVVRNHERSCTLKQSDRR